MTILRYAEERVLLSLISNTTKSFPINKSVFRSTSMKMVVDMQSDFTRILISGKVFLFLNLSFLDYLIRLDLLKHELLPT